MGDRVVGSEGIGGMKRRGKREERRCKKLE